MSTAPVTLAAPKESVAKKIESFFTKFGDAIKNIVNGAVNVAEQEMPAIQPLLSPALYSKVATLTAAAAQQVAAVDAKYAAIGQSTVPFGVKVAEAIAAGGTTVVSLAAQFGLQIVDVTGFFTAAANIAQSLNVTNLTATPVVPAATTSTATSGATPTA